MGYDDYKTQKAKELKQNIPYSNGEWNPKYLYEYLVQVNYDGSDSQIGAVFILRQMDKSALAANKELVLLAQQNEVYWKRPLAEDDDLSWLS